jgi:exopolysaccharide biosynthesis polyprenyl glycosylphosphotransferase
MSRDRPGGTRSALSAPAVALREHWHQASPARTRAADWRGRRDPLSRRAFAIADVIALIVAITFAFAVSPGRHGPSDLLLFLPTIPVWIGLFALYGLYHRDAKRVGRSALDDLSGVFHALVVGGLLLWVYFRVLATPHLILAEAIVFSATAMLLVPLLRAAAGRALATSLGPERVAFLGDAEVFSVLARKLSAHPEYRLEVVGYVDFGAQSFDDAVVKQRIERVIVSQAQMDAEAMLDFLQRCRRLEVKVMIVPDHVEAVGPAVEIADIEGITVLGLSPPTLSRSSRALKRAMDIVGAAVGLALSSPILIVAAIAIKLDTGGPVLFKQHRVGVGGRGFQLFKLRTMVVDAEEQRAELFAQSQDPDWLKLEHDPRVTKVGRLLRMTSLDELPQLWNVLVGDMSLVGPRPLPGVEDERVTGWGRTRLDLSPGITGIWQVLGRANIPFEEMVKLDYIYVTNWSPWLDIKLLFRTVPAVLRRDGAN